MYALILSFSLIGVLIIILGILIRECKCYNLMAGYNTMPAEKKKTYNPEPLARKTGIFLYGAGAATVATGIGLHFTQSSKIQVLLITLGYSLALVVACIIFIAKEAQNLNDV